MPAKKLSVGGNGSCGCVGGPGMMSGGAAKTARKAAKRVGKAVRAVFAKMKGGCACDGGEPGVGAGAAGGATAAGFTVSWTKVLVVLQIALVVLVGWMAWAMWSRRGSAGASSAAARDDDAERPLAVHHAGYVRGPVEQPPMRIAGVGLGGDIRNAPGLQISPTSDPAYPLRGVPQSFQQMGTIVSSAPDASPDAQPTILPLVGRPSPTNRDRWNYYTATDQYNMMRVAVAVDGKDCQEDVGCREITNGDTISVPAYKKDFTAQIYKYDRPQYNPSGPSTVTIAI